MKRDQFTFYRSYYEAIRTLPKKEQTAVLLAVCSYALDGEVPELSGAALSVFTLIRPVLDSGRKKASNWNRKRTTTEHQGNNNGTSKEHQPHSEGE